MARRTDHTREELTQLAIDCGRKLVTDGGPGELTARKVAQAMGYTPGTLYNLFENIDALAAAINRDTLEQFAETIAAIISLSKTPTSKLTRICQAYLELKHAQPHLWSLLFATPITYESEAYSAAIHKVFDQVTAAIRPLSESDASARQDAKIIWSTLHGICLLQQSGKLDVTEADPAQALVARFLEQFLAR